MKLYTDKDKRTVIEFIIEPAKNEWELQRMYKVIKALYPEIQVVSHYKELQPQLR